MLSALLRNITENLRAVVRSMLFFGWIFISLPYTSFTYAVSKKLHKRSVSIFLNVLIKTLSIKIKVVNAELTSSQPKLYVSNHTSYLDIFIIGSVLQTRFTPKIEVSGWFLVNYIVMLSMPLYIHRTPKKSLEQKRVIRDAILNGDNIIVFPEATTNNGRGVLPFKSSLFSVAEPEFESDIEEHIPIQPISIIYTKYNGRKIGADNIDKIAWHGDMTFLPHLWNVFKAKNIEVEIVYHPEVYFNNFTDRKTLAKHCHEIIEKEFVKYQSPVQ